jgi:phosphopantothenate-cysteine ligase/phosphopantothenoylcysteine decarboxylase/phosphopantothenate--cysteine ligase
MRILVTAGNTQTPVDRVRCITNIFTGRTGATIAREAGRRGHDVVLLTSHPEAIPPFRSVGESAACDQGVDRLECRTFRTFDDLAEAMARLVGAGRFDAVIHSAAVSDYRIGGVLAASSAAPDGLPLPASGAPLVPPASSLVDAADGKVKSTHAELWLRLVPTPKLVDQIRSSWGFDGVLVKFKLEVGVSDRRLREIADRSRRHSRADLIVANTLEDRESCAFLTGDEHDFIRIARTDLATTVVDEVERLYARRRIAPLPSPPRRAVPGTSTPTASASMAAF